MGDAFSVPFILSWCQRVNICVNTNSVWCIRFGLSIHTNTPLRIRIVFARPNENAYYLLRNMHNASSIYDIWHHRIRKPPFWSIHTKMRSRRFEKSPLWRLFLKSCVLGDRFHQIRMNGAYAGHFKSSFQVSNIVVKIAKLVSTLAIRPAIRASKAATEHCCPPKWTFSFKGAFQKSELAGGPWPDQSFWPWNRLFPRGFAKKSSPPYIPCRIWQIWLDGLNQFNDFLTQQGNLTCHQSGNRKYHSTETLSLLVTGHIFKAMDKKEITAMVLIDGSKAFDRICHRT